MGSDHFVKLTSGGFDYVTWAKLFALVEFVPPHLNNSMSFM